VDLDEVLAATFTLVAPHLTERQRRLLFGAAARALGYGGVSRVARLAEASRPTVRRGAAELDQPADPRGRIRQHEGPKRLHERDPGLLEMLDRLVEPDTRVDPQSSLRWTCKSTRQLAQALTAQGHPVSDDTVGRLLKHEAVACCIDGLRVGMGTGVTCSRFFRTDENFRMSQPARWNGAASQAATK
jgi:Rhodopirellula transposase DDE domain